MLKKNHRVHGKGSEVRKHYCQPAASAHVRVALYYNILKLIIKCYILIHYYKIVLVFP